VRDDRPFGGPAAPAAVLFYSPDRGGEHPQQHLANYAGLMQADAYAGFNKLYAPSRQPRPIVEAGCWAHARRKFFDLARLWVGMDMTERPTQDFEKNGWSGIGKTEGPRWNPIGCSMSIRSWRVAIPKDFSCQRIPRQNLRTEAERLHPSYTLWVGMDMTERPTQDF
jgi:hypothetical protein